MRNIGGHPERGSTQREPIIVRTGGTLHYADWRMYKYELLDGIQQRIPVGPTLVGLNRDNWESLVIQGVSQSTSERHVESLYNRQALRFPHYLASSDLSKHILNTIAIHELEAGKQIGRIGRFDLVPYKNEKQRVLRKLATTVKGSSKYQAIRDAWEGIALPKDPNADNNRDNMTALMGDNLRGLFLLAGTHNRFLAGFDGRAPLWKSVEMPLVYKETGVPLFHASTPFIELLDQVTKSWLVDILPSRIPGPGHHEINIPGSNPPVADSLARVYYHQRFILTPEGMLITPRNGGDIRRVRLVESAGSVLALSETKDGKQFTTAIDIETGEGYSSDTMSSMLSGLDMQEAFQKSDLVRFVTRVYGSMLCDGSNSRGKGKHNQRIPYEGESRPFEPHIRRGHRRLVGERGMSLSQLDKVAQFLESGLSVPKPAADETIVSPSVVPAGAEAVIAAAPKIVRGFHQDQAFDKEFKGEGELLTLEMLDGLRQEIIARRAQFAN